MGAMSIFTAKISDAYCSVGVVSGLQSLSADDRGAEINHNGGRRSNRSQQAVEQYGGLDEFADVRHFGARLVRRLRIAPLRHRSLRVNHP